MAFSKQIRSLLFLLFAVGFLNISCSDEDSSNTDFGIFSIVSDTIVEMNGDISSSTLDDFNRLIENYPNISIINMKEVPGSLDDEINLQVALEVHQHNIATHLLSNGYIASGGVDFFLAGTTRTKGANTMIGVHSWSDGNTEASEFPREHISHQLYINYYKNVGFSQEDAEAFYFFTIYAAPADDIYYMTEAEIGEYKILTQ